MNDKPLTPRAPDRRPDATRIAEIEQAQKRQLEAVTRLVESGCDARNLPMVAIAHYDGDFPKTFDEALARADLVVTGHVTTTSFTVDPNSRLPRGASTLAVETTLKGRDASEITFQQEGGPMPQDGGIIGHFSGAPILLPGDEVLLIAQARADGGGYGSVYPMGIYFIRDGVMSVPDGSPCGWLDGRSVTDALALVRASLSGDSQESAQACDWSRF
jgi:hypothetical protein